MTSRTSGCLIGILVFVLLASIAINFFQFVALVGVGFTPVETVRPKDTFHEYLEEDAKAGSEDKVARIDLEGIISSVGVETFFGDGGPMVDTLKRALEQAVNDPEIKAIVLRINTPGGEVTASDIIYSAVKSAAAKKPVVVYMDSMATSGGYYVSCGATKIVASETTLTASIGVIIETLNYSQLFDKVGLEMKSFVSGNFKDTLSGARPMREDEKAYVQNLVGQMYERFLGIVSEARKVPKDQLRGTVADGRVVTGREALAAKLVDKLGYIEDAYALARELGNSPDAMVVKYRRATGLFDVLGVAAEKSAQHGGKVELEVSTGLMPKLRPGCPYYLPPSFAQ